MSIEFLLSRAFSITWGAWGLFWLLAAGWSAPNAERQSPRARSLHLAAVLIGGGLLVARPGPTSLLGHPLFGIGADAAVVGLALTALGLGFASWARVALGRMWSGLVTFKTGHVIVDHGPYAIARHPIYTGLLLAIAGTALARDSVAGYLGLAILTVGLILKLGQEERLLLGHFGPTYEEYRGRVKGLIPFVW